MTVADVGRRERSTSMQLRLPWNRFR